jgi:hypothetical protein
VCLSSFLSQSVFKYTKEIKDQIFFLWHGCRIYGAMIDHQAVTSQDMVISIALTKKKEE